MLEYVIRNPCADVNKDDFSINHASYKKELKLIDIVSYMHLDFDIVLAKKELEFNKSNTGYKTLLQEVDVI